MRISTIAHTCRLAGWLALVGIVGAFAAPRESSGFVLFETGQVRPLAMSPDGSRLFACNTPDNALEIFDISGGGLTHVATVPVGLEPLAVAARTDTEVWVVNHLSDSVSIVDVSTIATARVVRTLHVGDEPRDIVFAGASNDRAFITTAHRGQNTPLQPTIMDELRTPGIGRADVWVFDAGNLGSSLGGDELTVVTLFGDTPRALAVSPDGSKVYAAVFHSGNQTTSLNEGAVPNGGEGNGGLPEPNTNHAGIPGPEVGLIVKYDGAAWVDELGRDWSSSVRFDLPDEDVFVIDANANPPEQVAGAAGVYAGVGTILFNMVAHPSNGKVYVANTEAFNEVRFEGPGEFSSMFGASTVRGHLTESRITVLDSLGGVTPRHLNKHIDYNDCCDPLPNSVNDRSLAFPLGMAVSSDVPPMLYVAAFGSSKVGVFDTTELETDSFVPSTADHIELTGGGPTGLVLDETNSRLYVLTRFDNSISVVSTGTGMEVAHLPLHNPEPDSVVEGRRFLYDARFTSSHGDQACASCHIFGDFDSLGWDLGDPDGDVINNPGPFSIPLLPLFGDPDFHPMKGPMTTQSLRGMDNHGPMHWRGDRTGGNDQANSQPDGGTFSEDAAFKKFNPAFEGLVGRSEPLADEEMQSFTDFILQVMYPPNPIRNLDNSLTTEQQVASDFFFGPASDTFENCDGCHKTAANGNAVYGVERPGFFGSAGFYSFENETQFFKVPHLRNMYQKVGMFGMPAVPFINPGDNAHTGAQVRGFGFLHDGSIDTLFRFHSATVFNQSGINPDGIPVGAPGDQLRQDMEEFMMVFPSNFAPIVGQQATRTDTSGVPVDDRIDLLLARADAVPSECDVVVKGIWGGEARGAIYTGSGMFETDREVDGSFADATLRAFADTAGQELTFTAVPPGEGARLGVDRDEDGYRDRDELDFGGDPNDPLSLPCLTETALTPKYKANLIDVRGKATIKAKVVAAGYAGDTVTLALEDSDGPIFTGATVATALELNNAGNSYRFKSRDPGIVRVIVKEDPKVADGYKVILKTKEAWAPGEADETEATTTVQFSLGGACFSGNATKVK